MAATALGQVEGGENGTDQALASENPDENPWKNYWYTIGPLILAAVIAWIVEHFFNGISRAMNFVLAKFWKKEEASSTRQPKLADQINVVCGETARSAGRDYHETNINLSREALELLNKSYQPPEPPRLDELPPRGDLPPGSCVPFSPNKVFTGRVEDLLELARSLFRSESKGVTITQTAAFATGLGGVGKTQLAIEFCYLYGRFFHGVHWIQADHDIAAEVAACGQEMSISPWPNELEERTNITLQAWKEAGPRLVIFDNVEDPALVQDWQPRLPKARLLFTSRSSDWPPGLDIEHHPLGVLPRSESLELLRKLADRLKDVTDEELDLVADRLGDLPLALDLAGNYLRSRPTLSPKEYLMELDEAGRSLLEHPAFSDWVKHNPTKHSTSLVYTFALSWNQLTDGATDELAGRIFRACGYCAPNTPIPWELLAKTVCAEDTSQRQNLDHALNRLRGLGLITAAEGGSIVIHPLLAEFARIQDQDACESALPGLSEALFVLASRANKTALPRELEPLREHLGSVAQAAQDAELKIAGNLWNELGYYLRSIADYKVAKKHHERALEIDEKAYGPKHPNVAIKLNNLGRVLHEMGELKGAKVCFERALKIDEKVLGPDHPNVAIRVNNLGLVLKDMGDLKGAKEHIERALEIDEKACGPDHPNVATRNNNLGLVLNDMGDLAGAKERIEQALEIDEKVLGADHPDLAIDVNNLGVVLRAMGDLEGAKERHERALRISEKAFGPDHPNVARNINNIGTVLNDMGDLAGAKEHFDRALEVFLHFLGEDHPDTIKARENLESLRR
ncbi:tetratricopeptide repeat protein [Methanotrichaceae archaeon M04Ac]|uniref:Tetratricopeptide repeat protein n=1 Tax=Candidatus Methanocrinis alkalitolerans TaxID=3033395 RepID=A0ABT5XGM6_9EURY|nr:tetratricopeptide repeat protein [Candidatus Methanocrinis alkalitolerans]MDF0593815.1 tetratricopeptide repeat protein [Candidatus Methanocrinis alkalitolerans]